MDINKAKEIISALAEGIDPTTGELLSDDNVCNKGEVVRAFYTILKELEPKKKKTLPENNGKPWTKEDEEHLISLYQNGLTKKEIAKEFGRTVGGISARMARLGLEE